MKQRITPKLSDSIFEGVDIPDDKTIRKQTALAKRELSGWYEKNSQRYEDQEYKDRWSKKIRESYANNESLRNIQRDKVLGKKCTDEHKENVRKARLNAPPRTIETKQKISKAQKGNTKRCRPIVTPFGIYFSIKQAAEKLNEIRNFKNGRRVLLNLIKKQPQDYYHISKEEYALILDKSKNN